MTNKAVVEVIYRLEPGCLGPDGAQYITEFCQFAQPLVSSHALLMASIQWMHRAAPDEFAHSKRALDALVEWTARLAD